MLIIGDVLVSDDVVKKQFLCNLSACKGACCVEGDFGAPLEDEEIRILQDIYEDVKPYLTEEGIAAIEKLGVSVYYEEDESNGTSLINGKACSFISYDSLGIAKCGIEQAYYDGVVDFKKPISCELYPIRIETNESGSFEAMNYDKWDICNAACTLGKEKELPVYEFLKNAIIRKYGEEFYNELDAAAKHLNG